MAAEPTLYGLLAEFADAAALRAAIRAARDAGYQCLDAYTPIPLEGLHEELGHRSTRLPVLVFLGGLCGALGGYALQVYTTVFAYPLNVGGRPLHSWPAFGPVTFETAILGAVLAAVLGMLALNGLPRPHHPLFAVPEFKLASTDRFFLCLEARDPRFELDAARELLARQAPREVWEVPS